MNKYIALLLTTLLFFIGCKTETPPESKKEIFIYCGITMISPMKEIADIFEKQHNITVNFMYEGSSALKKAIELNQTGDLYFPGSEIYLKSLENDNAILAKQKVGYNKAAIFVHKGNPKNINKDLTHLTNPALNVVVAKADEGSIGRETKKILDRAGVYEDVIRNSTYLTIDSKGINQALKKNDADISINWKATAFFPRNKDLIQHIDIDEQYAKKHPLVLAVIKYSKHPDLAKAFLNLASSETGQLIFKKYGFID